MSARSGSGASSRTLVALGVNERGYREILGLQLGDSESERSWMSLFTWLKGRGLAGVDLVVSDHHSGLVNAIQVQFQGATWQRCQTHLSANVADVTPKSLQEEIHGRLHAILDAPDPQTAQTLLARFAADFEQRAPAAVATLERGFDDATAVLALPLHYRRRLRATTTNRRPLSHTPLKAIRLPYHPKYRHSRILLVNVDQATANRAKRERRVVVGGSPSNQW